MRFSKTVSLANAAISKVEHRRVKGATRGSIEIRASLTPDIALVLGIYDAVYLKNGAPREAIPDQQIWKSGCGAFRAVHEPTGLTQSFEVDGDMISDIKVEPSGKKKAGLRVSMKLHYGGSDKLVLEFMGYWLTVGAAPGTCKIIPAAENQQNIVAPPPETATLFDAGKKSKPAKASAKGGLVN